MGHCYCSSWLMLLVALFALPLMAAPMENNLRIAAAQHDHAALTSSPDGPSSTSEWQLAVVVALSRNSLGVLRCLLSAEECPSAGATDPLGPLLHYLDLAPHEQHGRGRPLSTLFHLPGSTRYAWLRNSAALSKERQEAFDAIKANTMIPCGFGEECEDQILPFTMIIHVAQFNYVEPASGCPTHTPPEPLKIVLITDQIDRTFVRWGSGMDDLKRVWNLNITFYIPPGSETVANYYYFTLGKQAGVQMLLPNSLGVPFVTPPQNLMDLMNPKWHLIYVVALSDNVSSTQFDQIKRSISEPVGAYRLRHSEDFTLEVWTIFPTLTKMEQTTQLCSFVSKDHSADIGDYLTTNVNRTENVLRNAQQERFSTEALFYAWTCYAQQLGARLSQRMDADVNLIKGNAYLQKRPRIYFITDYVEQNLIKTGGSEMVPDRAAELHIYALNEEVHRQYANYYRDTAIIVDFSLENGTAILIEEPEHLPPPHPRPTNRVFSLFNIVAAALSVGLIVALGTAAFIYRSKLRWIEKVNWLHADHERTRETKKLVVAVDPLLLSWRRLALEEMVGDGAFGQVYRARLFGEPESGSVCSGNKSGDFSEGIHRCTEPLEVAVKVIPSHVGEASRHEFLREIKLMKSLPHNEHLVRLIGCICEGPRPCLVLEFCAKGSLLAHVRRLGAECPSPPDKQFAMFAWQICTGVDFLHRLHLLHRDLAARNVLIDAHNKIKICDFGLCQKFVPGQQPDEPPSPKAKDPARGRVATVWPESRGMGGRRRYAIKWLAPECLKRRQFSPKSDVWSLGVLLFEMYSFGAAPFGDIEPQQMLAHLESGNRLPRPQCCPDKIWEIMHQCWAEAPQQRPDCGELLGTFASILEAMTERYGYLDLAAGDLESTTGTDGTAK